MKTNPRVWVIVICPFSGIDKPQYLVGRRGPTCRNPGQWNFLGGNVDPGETLRQAAVREVYEESSLRLPESGLTQVFKDLVKAKPVTWFATRSKDVTNLSSLQTSSEIVEYAWADSSWSDRKDLHYSVSKFFEWGRVRRDHYMLDIHGIITELQSKRLT